MNHEPLPRGLGELEEALARRLGPEPAADFRARILGALCGIRAQPVVRWRRLWHAAAAVLLALNLAMAVGNGIRFQRLSTLALAARDRPAPPAGADVWEEQLPGFAAVAVMNLTPAPDVGAVRGHFFSQ